MERHVDVIFRYQAADDGDDAASNVPGMQLDVRQATNQSASTHGAFTQVVQ